MEEKLTSQTKNEESQSNLPTEEDPHWCFSCHHCTEYIRGFNNYKRHLKDKHGISDDKKYPQENSL